MRIISRRKKYKKEHKGKSFNKIGNSHTFNAVCFKKVVKLVASDFSYFSVKQTKMTRLLCKRGIKKIGAPRIRICADKPVTQKSVGIRMGKGKGSLHHWISRMSVGEPIIRLYMITKYHTKFGLHTLNILRKKLPLRTKIIIY